MGVQAVSHVETSADQLCQVTSDCPRRQTAAVHLNLARRSKALPPMEPDAADPIDCASVCLWSEQALTKKAVGSDEKPSRPAAKLAERNVDESSADL
jgi:hypothetical protein